MTASDDDQGEQRPNSQAAVPISLRSHDGYCIWAELDSQGALVISGQDLRPSFGWEEYEYSFTVHSEDLRLVRSAMNATQDDSVLDLVVANSERFMSGELGSWLDAIGARYEFWSRIEPGHG